MAAFAVNRLAFFEAIAACGVAVAALVTVGIAPLAAGLVDVCLVIAGVGVGSIRHPPAVGTRLDRRVSTPTRQSRGSG